MSTPISTLNKNIDSLEEQIGEFQEQIIKDRETVDKHPFIFILVLILFFMSMHVSSLALIETLSYMNPKGYLTHWEYILLAVILVIILMWAVDRSNIQFHLLGLG